MNRQVYPVRGGMEDWAYAASWDNKYTTPLPVHACVNDARAAPIRRTRRRRLHTMMWCSDLSNFLVETSNSKDPSPLDLGATSDLLKPSGNPHNGHVARNIRLMLMQLDLLVPIPEWDLSFMTKDQPSDNVPAGANGTILADPSVQLALGSCSAIPLNDSMPATLAFSVWGTLQVDAAEIVLLPWPKVDGKARCEDVCGRRRRCSECREGTRRKGFHRRAGKVGRAAQRSGALAVHRSAGC